MRLLCTLFALALACAACGPELPPAPTEIHDPGELDDEVSQKARERYEALLHKAAPGTDWRKLEARNAMARHQLRANRPFEKSLETFADGLIVAEWIERGSKFTAGSVHDVIQDPEDPNQLFILADGGSLWSMDYANETFTLVNHDIQLTSNFPGFIPTSGGYRMIAFLGRRPVYSDDRGRNWSFGEIYDANGSPVDESDINAHANATIDGDDILVTFRLSGEDESHVYRSTDFGRSYTKENQPPFEVSGERQRLSHLYHPPGTDRTFLVMRKTGDNPMIRLYEVDAEGERLAYRFINEVELASSPFRAHVAAAVQPGTDSLRIYLQSDRQLFRSDNDGVDLHEMPELATRPWLQQSLYVQASDPDFVAFGAVELYVSRDGGETFERPNRWFEYYDDIDKYLHADIMYLTEITEADGTPRVLVSSHGGLNRLDTTDGLWYNIAKEGLNVAQYYDVLTNPVNRGLIAAGSQDQGLQFLEQTEEDRRDILGGYQFISGDYGHLQYADDGEVIFVQYPFGTTYAFYDLVRAESIDYSRYEVDSPDEFIWIAPTMSPPGPGAVQYVAGGSAEEGKEGSYLIKMTLDRNRLGGNFGEITAEDLPFDFIDAGGGQLSALGYSPLLEGRFYAATEQGRFYTSDDAGMSWTETLNFLPEGWYLYGQAIYASRTEAETVWLGGSGYSNPPVWRSTDGGANFFPASEGLPPTTVIDLASNATETLLFAATEAGPFVYVMADERWYDLAGDFAPTQRYTSVEFIEEENIARFGTYGRGIWDFAIEEVVAADQPVAADELLRIFPNPANGRVTVEGEAFAYRLYDITGRELLRERANGPRTDINLTAFPAGLYFVQPLDGQGRASGLGQRLVVE